MTETLADALEREHREIDANLARFGADPQGAHAELALAAAALRRHIYLEEEFLFPALRAAGLVAPVFVMLREHGELWRTLDALQVDARVAPTGPEVAELLRELEVRLQHHNVKEERILYPQSDDALDPAARERLREFLSGGTMPDGWVCEKAAR